MRLERAGGCSGCSSSSTATSQRSPSPAPGCLSIFKQGEDRREALAERQRAGHNVRQVTKARLARAPFLVAERYSIADIVLYTCTHVVRRDGIDLAPCAGIPGLATPGRCSAGPHPDHGAGRLNGAAQANSRSPSSSRYRWATYSP
ncbi:MAG: glutathione binding-like protein [Geminicoccaceae bacterium]